MAEEEKQVAYDDGFGDGNNIPDSNKKKKKMKLLKEAAEADNHGACYLNRVPPHLDHVTLRQLLSQYGEILRIYLTPSAYKTAIREQKLALQLSAAKRERDFYLSKVNQSRALSAIEERMKKNQKVQEESGMNSELPVTQKKAIRQFWQKKPVAVDSSQGKPRLSKDILAGYSLVLNNQGLKVLGWRTMSEELLPISMI